MDEVQEVSQQDEEDRKDIDHADTRLDEEHAIETNEGRCGKCEKPVGPQPPREQVHHRNAERSEYAGGDPPAERVEPQVDVIARGALEMGAIPAVRPFAGAD